MAQPVKSITKEPQEVFNYCTKYLIRERSAEAKEYSEGWRFPLVMTCLNNDQVCHLNNEVTFIYKKAKGETINSIEITGSFLPLYQTLPLQPLMFMDAASGLYYLTVQLPVGTGYYYRFLVNGNYVLDPINPQRTVHATGKEWSFFFTDFYNYSTDFEEWEMNLLYRLIEQIVPFRTLDAQNFINRFYQNQARHIQDIIPLHRLDESVGEVNYITNILAREERHYLQDYKICIQLIDEVLRSRYPAINSWNVPSAGIEQLYNEMADGNVAGWDYNKYNNPRHFLKTLRRHSITGAFCHPRHGGNVGGAGWNYLKERYTARDKNGQPIESYFNWDKAIERPIGSNEDYLG